MSLSHTDVAAIQKIVTDTVLAVLHQAARLNGQLSYSELDAARLLGTSKHILRDARYRGEIKGCRIGAKIHYTREELLHFLAECEIQ